MLLPLLFASLSAPLPEARTVRIAPRTIRGILANPHMGWQTFHTTADRDRALPAWIPSTVAYYRWGWRELEPERGRLNTALVDSTIEAARRAGQRLAFRVMSCSSTAAEPYHPDWLAGAGGVVRRTHYDGVPLDVPDLDDPTTLELHLDLIRRLAARYDGHPGIDHVDLGSVGWWGEWHMSGGGPVAMPTPETCRRIIDAYFSGFRRTPLLMLVGGGEHTAYACEKGAGWRADCLGDMGGFSRTWCHMRRGYPEWFRQGRLADVWKRAPVAYESCWDMRRWVSEGWPLRYIFNYALATHASYLNNKSAPLPEGPEVRAEIERFLERLGYRLELRDVRHAAAVRAGGALEVQSQWRNTGSAPCYRDYRVAWRLRRGENAGAPALGPSVRAWMPGHVEPFTEAFLQAPPDLPPGPLSTHRDRLPVPAGLASGVYALEVAVVDPATLAPVVRLAIDGRREDGWYFVSQVSVMRSGP
ncbi:MAG TPA: DUF4832 domain-containing protein [Chthonomonadales bacterium]|nr:DUF4832 domain-containing protein [Chthonomonadales bacterium]